MACLTTVLMFSILAYSSIVTTFPYINLPASSVSVCSQLIFTKGIPQNRNVALKPSPSDASET